MSRWGLQQSGQFDKRDFLFSKLVNNEKLKLLPILYDGKLRNHIKYTFFIDAIQTKVYKELQFEGEESGLLVKIRNYELFTLRRGNHTQFGSKFIYSAFVDGEVKIFSTGNTIHNVIDEYDITDMKKTNILNIKSDMIRSYGGQMYPSYYESFVKVYDDPIDIIIPDMTDYFNTNFKVSSNILMEKFPDSYHKVIEKLRDEKLEILLN
jgi:hypothetical protein